MVLNSDSLVISEFTIVMVLSFRPLSPVCWTPSISAYFHSPFWTDESFLTSISNGIVSVSLYWPFVFEPTSITLVTGSLVVLYSPRTWSDFSPLVYFCVTVLSLEPFSPGVISLISFGARSGLIVTFVSYGITSLSIYSNSPVKSSSPTRITAFWASFVTLGSDVFVTFEFSIVRVFSCSPTTPFNSLPSSSVAYFHSPFLSDGSFLTSTSNGISSLTFSVPLVLPPILTTLFWPASSVLEVTTFFWSLS